MNFIIVGFREYNRAIRSYKSTLQKAISNSFIFLNQIISSISLLIKSYISPYLNLIQLKVIDLLDSYYLIKAKIVEAKIVEAFLNKGSSPNKRAYIKDISNNTKSFLQK